MIIIKKIINKMEQFYLKHLSPEQKAKYLKKKCYHMGDNVLIFTESVGTEPHLVNIQDNVIVASCVVFITHDVSAFTVSRYLGLDSPLDKVGPITLDENCMIGAYSLLMPGCYVGKNSIIAAGSVVVGRIPDNEVWGGTPAHFIMKMDDYAQKLYNKNKEYTWMDNCKRMNLPIRELIQLRQEYFFNTKEKSIN